MIPRHPDGRIDWLILEGDLLIGFMVLCIVGLFIEAMTA